MDSFIFVRSIREAFDPCERLGDNPYGDFGIISLENGQSRTPVPTDRPKFNTFPLQRRSENASAKEF